MMELTSQVIEASPNPVYVKNAEGKFILANHAFARLHGLSVPQLIQSGEIGFDYSCERDADVLNTGEPVTFEEFYKLDNGEKVWYKTVKKTITGPDGTTYLLSTSADITDIKTALQLAEETARRKERFLSNMSSEIRTPVNAILGMARLMKKSILNKHQEEYINTIMSIAEELLSIPNDILEFSKLESGIISLAAFPFNVTATLHDIVLALKAKATEHGIDLKYIEGKDSIPTIKGDSFRLSQILIALVGNAIKYSSQGEITIAASIKEKINDTLYIEFCVKSTGLGMIANKFTDLSNGSISNAVKYGSTGLGFNLCKTLIEIQGGKMWVEGKSRKESSFYFVLPFQVCEATEVIDTIAGTLNHEAVKGLKVLLAEDNQINQLLVSTQLKSWGVEVEAVFDGTEALDKTREHKYDLILMDIQMPRLNGIDATSHIRNDSNLNQATPIIAFTANIAQADEEQYKSYGFDGFLLKPYPSQKLLETVAQYTGNSNCAKQIHVPDNKSQPSGEEEPLYDFSGLGELAKDAVFVNKMQRLFIDTVPGQLSELSEAIQKQEWEKTVQIAHRLKSTFGNIKIRQATELMKLIQDKAAKRPDRDELLHSLRIINTVIDEVLAAFSQEQKAAY